MKITFYIIYALTNLCKLIRSSADDFKHLNESRGNSCGCLSLYHKMFLSNSRSRMSLFIVRRGDAQPQAGEFVSSHSNTIAFTPVVQTGRAYAIEAFSRFGMKLGRGFDGSRISRPFIRTLSFPLLLSVETFRVDFCPNQSPWLTVTRDP